LPENSSVSLGRFSESQIHVYDGQSQITETKVESSGDVSRKAPRLQE